MNNFNVPQKSSFPSPGGSRLWMPEEYVPEAVMAVMPDERSFETAQELFSSGPPLDENELYEIVNDRRKQIFQKFKEGFYDLNPGYLDIGRLENPEH